jgi:nitrogen regulatory protein P-II 1
MKLVIAIIRESKLDDVREALVEKAGIDRITIARVAGHGRQEKTQLYRGKVVVPNLISKIEVKIACNDDFVETVIDTILMSARQGEEGAIGDGKIFVTSLEECVRIRTGERGTKAI